MFKIMTKIGAATVLSAFILPVVAHTPYLVPGSFEPVRGDLVTLDASFTEEFFVPEIAFDKSEFFVISPDGTKSEVDTHHLLKTRNVVEHEIKEKGTYRFSTGKRLGRVFKVYELNGERESLENPTDPVPEGGKLLSFFQSVTMAETYVTNGKPSEAALKAKNTGLEFVALTHPNDLFVGDALELKSLFNGVPMKDFDIFVFHAQDQFGTKDEGLKITTDENGLFSFTAEQEGAYLLRGRYRTPAPKGSPAPEYSYTYTLVIEVVK